MIRAAMIGLLRIYKRWVSPLLPAACRFQPSCSEYAIQVIARDGVSRGSWRALGRILRCGPLLGGGLDLP